MIYTTTNLHFWMLPSYMKCTWRQLGPNSDLSRSKSKAARGKPCPATASKKQWKNTLLFRNNSACFSTGFLAFLALIAKRIGMKKLIYSCCLFLTWGHNSVGVPSKLLPPWQQGHQNRCPHLQVLSGKAFLEICNCTKQIIVYVLQAFIWNSQQDCLLIWPYQFLLY